MQANDMATLVTVLCILLAATTALTFLQGMRINYWKKRCGKLDQDLISTADKLHSAQRSGDQIMTTLSTLGVWDSTTHRWDLLPQGHLDAATDRLTKRISDMKANACSNELRAELDAAITIARDADQARTDAEKILKHYRETFIPSMVSERDRWHDMYMDAIVTYGNAQDRYERAIEYLSKRAKVPFPSEVKAVMDANRAMAEKGKATPKLEAVDLEAQK